MPRIENDIKLDFKDVLLRPKRSTLKSRSEVGHPAVDLHPVWPDVQKFLFHCYFLKFLLIFLFMGGEHTKYKHASIHYSFKLLL